MKVAKTMSQTAEQSSLPFLEETHTGIWPSQALRAATTLGVLQAEEDILADQIQPASVDLRLGSIAYQVPASFLPGHTASVSERLDTLAVQKFNIENGAILETDKVYIVPLQERLKLKKRMSGTANPKSSTGRLDVFARLITDNGTEFDQIPERYVGHLWLEIAPRSFNVKVRRGSRLAQMRLRSGSPRTSDATVRELNEMHQIVHYEQNADIKYSGLALSVDIEGDPISGVVGYKAKKSKNYVDVDKVNFYEIDEFWERLSRPDSGGLILNRDEFHILATKETVAIPNSVAADMVAYDTLVGEFRVHYAGFFDPGFGHSSRGPVGAKIVLEVRSHEVPFMIEHGQVVGRVTVERLTDVTDKPYGLEIGSSYHSQGLTLGKQFKR
jgi:dCTP deaminase